jgi:hypothetical protein
MESDTSSSSSNDVDDDELLDAAEVMCVAKAVLAWRCNRMTRSTLCWQNHVQMLMHEYQFHIMYRMTIHATSCYIVQTIFLAEGSYHDIRQMASFSKAPFIELSGIHFFQLTIVLP